jgi:hypothetical protein
MSCSSILNTARLCAPANKKKKNLVLDALHCTKISPSAKRVTVANAVCRITGIFTHNDMALKYIIKSNVPQIQFAVYPFLSYGSHLIIVYSPCLFSNGF